MIDLQASLKSFKPEHDYFIGIDSDGCVFDSMEVKQKEFFIPLALKNFSLFPISGILRKTWEHVNLYSITRGSNRFISLIKVFEILSRDNQVISSGVQLPDTTALREWVRVENKLGNENLRRYFEMHPDSGLEKILLWSEEVNREISKWLRNIPPFHHVRHALELISSQADIMIVSQTPGEALLREWQEHDLEKYVKEIAGQEHGTKTQQLALATAGKYDPDKILMVGDAKGDMEAALNNNVLFFPVIPGKEDESWSLLIDKGFSRFTGGTFRGIYQDNLISDFLASLPA
jgi:phosphoglycolate phosphatase-like HAD superfamily hydrolase